MPSILIGSPKKIKGIFPEIRGFWSLWEANADQPVDTLNPKPLNPKCMELLIQPTTARVIAVGLGFRVGV